MKEQKSKSYRIISTTIPIDVYTDIKKREIPFNHLIILGLKAMDDNPQLIRRINDLEKDKKQQENALIKLGERYRDLNERIGVNNEK